MMGMNQNLITFEQINYIMGQNPRIKSLVFDCVQNPIVMNQALNIINTLYYNPLIFNQFKNLREQEMNSITIIFRRAGLNESPIMIHCNLYDKVSDVIEKYRKESNDYDETKKFIYNAKPLYPSLTLSESGVIDNGNIFVVVTKGVKGG